MKDKLPEGICNKLEVRGKHVHVHTLTHWQKNFYLEVQIVEVKVTFLADRIRLDFI